MTEVEYQTFFKSYCKLYATQQTALLFVSKNGSELWLNDLLKERLQKFSISEPRSFIQQFFREQEEQLFRDLFRARLERVTVITHYQIQSIYCRLLITALNHGKNQFAGYQIEVQEMQEKSTLPANDHLVFPFRNPNPLLRLALNGDLQFANPAAHSFFCDEQRALLPEISTQLKSSFTFSNDQLNNVIIRIHAKERVFIATLSKDQEGISVFTNDITEIYKEEQSLLQNQGNLEKLINDSDAAVVMLDADHRIVFFNNKANTKSEQFLGQTLQNGSELPPFLDAHFQQKLERAIHAVYKRAKNFKFEIEWVDEHVESTWFRFRLSPITDEKGQVKSVYLTIQNITQKRKVELELHQTRNFYKTILNNLPADIAVFDLDHNYLFINPIAVKNDEVRNWMIGKNDYDYFKLKGLNFDIANQRRAIFNEVLQTRKTKDLIDQHKTADGNTSYVLRRFYPYAEDDELKLVIGYGIDITPIKEAEKDTITALDKERELNQLKSHFVSLASHEFRTPLATIQSSMDILNLYLHQSNELSPEMQKRFEVHHKRIEQEILWMTEIMNNILILGKMDAGKMAFRPEMCDLSELIQDLLGDRFSISMGEEHTDLEIIGDVYPLNIDPRLIQHVMSNLVSNAVKYSKGKGNTSVIMEYWNEKLIVRVKDQGIGIPAEEIPFLFTSFFRASNTLNIQGTGLGLTIIKQIVEMHAGSVRVISELGIGTEFIIELPRSLSLEV